MKKKIFFIALALTATTGLFAQKQTGGEKNIEVQFAPLSGKPVSISGLRLRMFNSENSAIRIGFNLNGSKETTVNAQAAEANGSTGQLVNIPELYDYNRATNFSLRLGYEKHFDGTDRLSPYVGAEVFFGLGRNSIEREFFGGNSQTQIDQNQVENFATFTATRKEGSTSFGLGAVAGFDFYISDALYIGAEIGYGFQRTTLRDVEVEISDENAYIYTPAANGDGDFSDVASITITNGTAAVEYATIVGDNSGDYRTFDWGPTFQPTLRLGWLFN
jgi:opacity protein-like surface antigen